MKILKNKVILVVISLLFLVNSMPYSYAFFDNTTRTKTALFQTGCWAFDSGSNTYFTSFENFTNTTCYVSKDIDGEVWSLCKIFDAQLETDKKIGDKSIRISNCGFLASHTYFTWLELISFYIGLAHNSDNRGPRKFSVAVSVNGSDWTNILTDSTNTSQFRLVSIDMKSVLQNGLTLADRTVANENTPLSVKISFNGCSPVGSFRLYNLDDLTIKYAG